MLKNKKLGFFLTITLVGYLCVCAYMYMQQGKLMYHPEQHGVDPLVHAVARISSAARVDTKYHAIVVEPEQQPSKGTVIFYHGNAGNAWKYLSYHQPFNAMGYRMVLAEYPGFGWRSGQPNQSQIVAEGLELYEHWRQRTPSEQPVILLGKSLGTGVVMAVAAQASIPPSKVVLLTPFTSITEVAAKKYWMLPVRWLLKDTFESVHYLSHYAGPISVLIAGQDEVIGSETGLKLLEQAKKRGPAELMMMPEADHNNWMPSLHEHQWHHLLQLEKQAHQSGPVSGFGVAYKTKSAAPNAVIPVTSIANSAAASASVLP